MNDFQITKERAVQLFGGTNVALAKALGVSRQAINSWPPVLTTRQANEVIGAAMRAGLIRNLAGLRRTVRKKMQAAA